MQRFRGGLVFKAHRRLYHSTLGVRVIKKKEKVPGEAQVEGGARGALDCLIYAEFARDCLMYAEFMLVTVLFMLATVLFLLTVLFIPNSLGSGTW